MWPFTQKEQSDFKRPDVPLYDLHNHILFNLDDGAADVNESIAMLEGFKRLGYQGISATPHHNHSMFKTPLKEELTDRINQLRKTADKLNLNIKTGAEIMLRGDYISDFDSSAFPGTGAAFLVEFPHQNTLAPKLFEQFIFNMAVKEKTIIIAHPERTPDFQNRPHLLKRYRELGALLQIDLMSITGIYGEYSKETVWELLESESADLAGSDLHKSKDLSKLEHALNTLAIYDEQQFIRLTSTNPGHIFNNNLHLIKS
jgi:protein-tyrosine phosphatase